MIRNIGLAAALLCICSSGCLSVGRSGGDGEAELAADESQEIISQYYSDHGELPHTNWLTAQVSERFGKERGIDPRWSFSCEMTDYKASTMVVRIGVKGSNIRTHSITYEMDPDSYREGARKKGAR